MAAANLVRLVMDGATIADFGKLFRGSLTRVEWAIDTPKS